MKKFKIVLVIFLLGVTLFTSCEKDADDHTFSGNPVIAFEKTSGSISESDEENTISISVFMNKTSQVAGTVDFIFDTEGIENPAVEGVDFELVNTSKTLSFGAGEYFMSIELKPLDNDVYDKNKDVKVVLTTGSVGAIVGYDNGESNVEFTVTFIDDEHPLAKWIGTYAVAAVSNINPGAWDEAWTVTTAPNPNDDTQLFMTGIAGSTEAIIADFNTTTMTIAIEAGTAIGDPYGWVDCAIYGFTGASIIVEGKVLGTISNDGNIVFPFMVISDASDPGNVWDIFTPTFTK